MSHAKTSRRRDRPPRLARARSLCASLLAMVALVGPGSGALPPAAAQDSSPHRDALTEHDRAIRRNIDSLFDEGRDTFRFDTFGDEAFWGDTLKLHLAIEESQLGGVGPGVSPKAALALEYLKSLPESQHRRGASVH